ncbi:MAG: anaerobic ribonucleoside-triphosphate reductase activating protein [Holosporales bacterium]|jgi:pyruvate formate lyase activating enzyme|nr:anaerobic ribonucleoside-triphosphate reductase activating protein [Holosporales bacterium]
MKIGGLLKFSALDYPGKLSCVVFCQGCSLRCVYCHNPDFLDQSKDGAVSFEKFIDFLRGRIGYLDAVVFSGGDPLLQHDLFDSILTVKEIGFLIGIHTSGVALESFERIIPLINWVGFDVKTVFHKYDTITGVLNSGQIAEKNLSVLLNSKTDYEVRTTYDSRVISSDDLIEIAQTLHKLGVKKWIIQECAIHKDNEIMKLPLPDYIIVDELLSIIQIELRQR